MNALLVQSFVAFQAFVRLAAMLVLDDELKALTVQSLVTFHASLVPLTVAFIAFTSAAVMFWFRVEFTVVFYVEFKAAKIASTVLL